MTTETKQNEIAPDDFDAAFAAAIATPADVVASKSVADPAKEPVADPVKEPVADPAKEPVAEAAKKAAEEEAARRKTAEDAARKVADEAAAKAKAEEEAKAKAEAEKKAAEEAEIKDPVLSPEAEKAIAEFKKEWPEQSAAVEAMMTHQVASLEARFARALGGLVGKLYEDLEPLAESVAVTENNSFRTAVLGAHKDYDTVYPKLEGWIAQRPAYLQDAYKRVYNEGTAEEIIDLVTQFKATQGLPPEVSGQPQPNAEVKPASKPRPTEQANELAPVKGQRTTPTPQGVDTNDFDGAFAEFAK